MIDTVGQAVAQAFIKSATIMGNTVHNAVVKTFAEGTFPGCMGPCYIQPNQMQYIPLEVSLAAALSAQNSQQKQVTVNRHHKLLLQHLRLQQLLSTSRVDLRLGFQKDGIQ